mmetsp:Transcript_28863/g.63594  ORF Transcript_28863/g.63594 Transcript_28863/m.63594 type:complete len:206 (-) Transcript_28863:723-1340(-)
MSEATACLTRTCCAVAVRLSLSTATREVPSIACCTSCVTLTHAASKPACQSAALSAPSPLCNTASLRPKPWLALMPLGSLPQKVHTRAELVDELNSSCCWVANCIRALHHVPAACLQPSAISSSTAAASCFLLSLPPSDDTRAAVSVTDCSGTAPSKYSCSSCLHIQAGSLGCLLCSCNSSTATTSSAIRSCISCCSISGGTDTS